MTNPCNIIIEQGATFYRKLIYTDNLGEVTNLTGYHANWSMQIGASIYEFYDTGITPAIIITGVSGQIEITIPASKTVLFLRNGRYDLNITSPTSVVTRLLSGTVTTSLEVSV